MSCQLANINLCGRSGDFMPPRSFGFTLDNSPFDVSNVDFAIDLTLFGTFVKRYTVGAGIDKVAPNHIVWSFGNVLELKDGLYKFGIKWFSGGFPQTILEGTLNVEKQIVANG